MVYAQTPGGERKKTLTQRSLVQILEVLFDMCHARSADEYRVPILALHEAVVRHPAQRDLGKRQAVLRRHVLDLRERGEIRVVPVS